VFVQPLRSLGEGVYDLFGLPLVRFTKDRAQKRRRHLVSFVAWTFGAPSKATLLLTKEPLRDPPEIFNAPDLSEERPSHERGIYRGELQEAVAGGGGDHEEDITEPARRLPVAVDLDEHAGETVERRIHIYG
jgi:hypothetical protein